MATDTDEDTTLNLKVYPDEQPKSGEWVDVDEVIASVTARERVEGQSQGETVEEDDDE